MPNGTVPTDEQESRAVEAAAAELGRRLQDLAGALAAVRRPKRISYGRGWGKRRSPAGFMVDRVNHQLLLPDGRLWSYNSGDGIHPAGRYFDARVDYRAFAHGRMLVGHKTTFVFLGATLGSYSFGIADGRLCAIAEEGGSLHVVDGSDAFDALAKRLVKRAAS